MTETENALVEGFCRSSGFEHFMKEAVLELAMRLEKPHRWQDLVFDIEIPEERESYVSSHAGAMLPITHTGDPLRHAQLCNQLFWGKQPWFMIVYSRANLRTDEFGKYPLNDVNFDTLEHDQAAMLEVFRVAKKVSQNASAARDRGLAPFGQATRAKVRKVVGEPTRRSTKRATKKPTRKR
ncbi:MAG TPA: hypothetical protein VKP30_30620 [Polyangiaceae bacterium]|nr:hypothetical protein [Polyangiaceae bacterium]